ncbi:hypothetical protein MMC26_004326 [Xylographa opegraphella]|nr:hypothetical protein [Xylographa opegraphella]
MSILDQAHKDGVVVGLRDVAGVAPRLDIDVLLLDHPDTFNLLLIALMELKAESLPWEVDDGFKVDKANKMSYFKLAGIHGLPREEWDKEPAEGKKNDSKDPGYCAHGTPTFATWHRPYLAMLEQTLFRQMANVAERFGRSDKLSPRRKQDYVEAAKRFRLPYWDYYRPRDYKVTMPGVFQGYKTTSPYDYHMPQIFTLQEVMVKTLPDEQLVAMSNPFFQYRFAPGDFTEEEWDASNIDVRDSFQAFASTFSRTLQVEVANVKEQTLRHGGNDDDAVEAMNQALNMIREDEMRASLVMIERGEYSNYLNFSTNGVEIEGPDPDDISAILKKNTGSLEALHNNYHVYIGGFTGPRGPKGKKTGHMTCVPVAAFDPVFWIHHCQIDRIFAIWQAVNDGHWFEELRVKHRHLVDDGLLPFRKYPLVVDKTKRFWTSNLARKTEDFGYTYADLYGKDQSVDQIRETFAKNYGWSRRLTPFQHFGHPPPEMKPLDLSKAQVYQYTSNAKSANQFRHLHLETEIQPSTQATLAAKPKMSHEWYIDDLVERMALNGSFTIFYIIGEVTGTSGREWTELPGFFGLTHVFAAPKEACDNCGRQEDQARLVTSTSAMTSLLLDYVETGKLQSMASTHVEPFLVKNLKWRVQTALGEVIDPRVMTRDYSLKLSISCKISPLPGETGDVTYTFHPAVIEDIIGNASELPTMATAGG